MLADYKVIVRSPAGVKRAETRDIWAATCAGRVNEPGQLTLELAGDHRILASLEDRAQVELWRRIPAAGVDWYKEFEGLHRAEGFDTRRDTSATLTAVGYLAMLGWRHVAWKANTANRSVFSGIKAATVMWRLVDYNAAANATAANGRELDAAITGLSAGSDPNSGPAIDWACAWANVLSELQKLQRLAGGDFDLIKTGAATWSWQFYPGQRGTDRSSGSSKVLFGVARGNMTDAVYRLDRRAEKTVAIVGGAGDEAARQIALSYAASYSADNHIEAFVDARSDADAALSTRGDAALEATRAKTQLSYKVLQVDSCLYGKHYFLGDLVRAEYADLSLTQQVIGRTLAWRRGQGEQVDVEMRDV